MTFLYEPPIARLVTSLLDKEPLLLVVYKTTANVTPGLQGIK